VTIIGFDIDGVIADFVTEFRKLVREEYGADLQESDIRAHALHLALGVTEEESNALIKRNLLREVELYPGAADGLQSVMRAGAEVHIITARARNGEGTEEVERWLAGRGLLLGQHYSRIDHASPRQKFTVDAHLDAFVDDDPDELLGMAANRPDVHLVVFDHPWNQTLDVHGRLHRVTDWRSLTDHLLGFLAMSNASAAVG
jgi:uncharacterized HAD superfamily protein